MLEEGNAKALKRIKLIVFNHVRSIRIPQEQEMSSSNSDRGGKTDSRKARLEQQLKANLRKRKDQARTRADVKTGDQGTAGKEGER